MHLIVVPERFVVDWTYAVEARITTAISTGSKKKEEIQKDLYCEMILAQIGTDESGAPDPNTIIVAIFEVSDEVLDLYQAFCKKKMAAKNS